MKLTRLLSDLILEQVKPDGSLPIVSFVYDKFLINLSVLSLIILNSGNNLTYNLAIGSIFRFLKLA